LGRKIICSSHSLSLIAASVALSYSSKAQIPPLSVFWFFPMDCPGDRVSCNFWLIKTYRCPELLRHRYLWNMTIPISCRFL
jgi:hypothetical protein